MSVSKHARGGLSKFSEKSHVLSQEMGPFTLEMSEEFSLLEKQQDLEIKQS